MIATQAEETPSSALAQLVARESQREKLSVVTAGIIQEYLPAEAVDCAPEQTFLTEILANAVLQKDVEKCSSADFINS